MVSTINQGTIKDLNLNISLASADVQLVKQIPIIDVNYVFCCLLLSNTAKNCTIPHSIYSKNNIKKIRPL